MSIIEYVCHVLTVNPAMNQIFAKTAHAGYFELLFWKIDHLASVECEDSKKWEADIAAE